MTVITKYCRAFFVILDQGLPNICYSVYTLYKRVKHRLIYDQLFACSDGYMKCQHLYSSRECRKNPLKEPTTDDNIVAKRGKLDTNSIPSIVGQNLPSNKRALLLIDYLRLLKYIRTHTWHEWASSERHHGLAEKLG